MTTKQSEGYKEQGNNAFRSGDFEKAVEMYTLAIECMPKNPSYYTNRATCYAKMSQWSKVLRDAERSLKIDIDWVKGWYRKGQALSKMENHKEAHAAFVKACALQPDNGEFKKLRDEEEAAWKKDFTPAQLKKDQANQLFKEGKIEDALAVFQEAIKMCGDDEKATKAAIHSNMAHCYMQLYKPKLQIEQCSACLELDPNNVKALLRRAQAYESIEKPRGALNDYERVCLLDPSQTMAQKGAARVRNALKNAGRNIS
uniref:Uncharacterized protein n=1 Tax=Sexangularia sp. CB-2014 TaxID=1486929 RepID=A0A7S1YDQ2_9EUKA|mmetsp:Transcript_2699/g.8674  ORF Transcript_2699/g.8674 Transcript_2699/m.8674 type:complete len:257 (+) Transcript_2699:100-870(+)